MLEKFKKMDLPKQAACVMLSATLCACLIGYLGFIGSTISPYGAGADPVVPEISSVIYNANSFSDNDYDYGDYDSHYDCYEISDEDGDDIASLYYNDDGCDIKLYVDADEYNCDETLEELSSAIILACDPTVSTYTAAKKIFDDSFYTGCSHNGVTYRADDDSSVNYTFELKLEDSSED